MDRPFNSDQLRNSDIEEAEPDREISLGTTTILGIFFGLALVCSLFFGLGYSMGRRSVPPTIVAATDTPGVTSSATKPSSGSLAERTSAVPDPAPTQVAQPVEAPAPPASIPTPAASTPEKPAPLLPSQAPASPAAAVVQVAAVSHREDAETLISNLKQRGYDVFIRQEPQDKLLRVQVGPFPTRKDAEAMRQRLLSDGYNAIVK